MPLSSFLSRVGERYGDFTLTKYLPIDELHCTLRELVHEPTGALVMHLENDDPENLFCLSFKTLPDSSNGAAHILEHTVLCGSKKFPVKDPFFAMNRRSLNTFMNAMTGSDFTCYPAASQVEKDFYNLLDVYIDATFHPELKEFSFLQEGHRLEFSHPEDPTSPLEYKGIVFNEMKGASNSPDTRLWHAMMACLVPDLPYCYDSGGDPAVIPTLSYADLIAFHQTYYHPSRCLFFFYGNLPLKKHLDTLNEKALKDVVKISPLPPLPKQPRFSTPVYKTMHYPINETEDLTAKTMVAFGWLTTPVLDQEDVLALCVLDSVLMETDASPLKLRLLQSGLCIQADAYLDTEMSEVPYFIVCKGCKEENADAIQHVLETALETIVQEGISVSMVEAAIHQLEFSRSEIVGDHAPFGLTLFMRSALAKQHGCDPEHALTIHTLFSDLRKKTQNPEYLTNLIKKYLLHNTHRVRLVMTPDPHLLSKEVAEEKKKLHQIRQALTDQETSAIIKQAKKLAVYQEEMENQSHECLPKVTLSDVPTLTRDFPLTQKDVGSLKLFHHGCFTNHIVYADLIFDLPELKEDELPYVQLFVSLLAEVGAGSRDYAQNLTYMHAYTGGISAACALHVQATDPSLMKPCLVIRGKALHRNVGKLLELMGDIVRSPRFDEKKRVEELILQIHSSLHSRFNKQALTYAIQLALSGFSVPTHILNTWHGINYYKTIETLAKQLPHNLPAIIDKLNQLKEKLLCIGHPHLVLGCDHEMAAHIEKMHAYGLADLPTHPFHPWKATYSLPSVSSQARTIASQVAFNVEAYRCISYAHPHAPALSAATHILDNTILHRSVREQGGAYGCGATFGAMTGTFYFHSYRDPHIAKTVQSFHAAINTIAKGQFDAEDLNEAKLGVIQQFDTPISPGSRAMTAYSWWRDGKSHAMRQHMRDRLLALTPKDVQQAIKQQLQPNIGTGTLVSFAGKELIEQENMTLSKHSRPLPIFPS